MAWGTAIVILSWSISPHDARAPDVQLGQHGDQARACSDARALAGRDVACVGRRARLAALARDLPRLWWLPGVSCRLPTAPTQRRDQQRPPLNMIRKKTLTPRGERD
jgi:hypothetical protein